MPSKSLLDLSRSLFAFPIPFSVSLLHPAESRRSLLGPGEQPSGRRGRDVAGFCALPVREGMCKSGPSPKSGVAKIRTGAHLGPVRPPPDPRPVPSFFSPLLLTEFE